MNQAEIAPDLQTIIQQLKSINNIKRTVVIKDSSDVNASGNTGIMRNDTHRNGYFLINVSNVTGTLPLLDINIDILDTISGAWKSIASKTGINATGLQLITIGEGGDTRNPLPSAYRVSWALAGTSPVFTFSISAQLSK